MWLKLFRRKSSVNVSNREKILEELKEAKIERQAANERVDQIYRDLQKLEESNQL